MRTVIAAFTLALAVIAFCVVQDRVTAEGARRYVAVQREAAAGRRSPVTIDEIMQPAVARSVRLGLAWGGGVAAIGLAIAAAAGRR